MNRRPPVIARACVIAVGLALALTACSANAQSAVNRRPTPRATDTAIVVDGVQTVQVTVDQTYRFSPSTITVHPGKVKIVLRHVGTGAPHDLQVVGFPGDYAPVVGPGESSQVTFTAPSPGRYRFECTIHVRQGQVGTLVVLPS